jgi:diadenosine tetraphosphate (Ap4A) HIT family hydrolase
MRTCPICEKHKHLENRIYEDEDWVVTHGPLASQILGYMYIEPKRHVENWSDFTDQELLKVGPLIKRLESALKKELNIERVYVVTISEAVRHLHFHIIPREKENAIKGIHLIEQATQQKVKTQTIINEESYHSFIKSFKKYFL